jgi:hypothetical protein
VKKAYQQNKTNGFTILFLRGRSIHDRDLTCIENSDPIGKKTNNRTNPPELSLASGDIWRRMADDRSHLDSTQWPLSKR